MQNKFLLNSLMLELLILKVHLKKLVDQFDFRDLIEDLIMITIP